MSCESYLRAPQKGRKRTERLCLTGSAGSVSAALALLSLFLLRFCHGRMVLVQQRQQRRCLPSSIGFPSLYRVRLGE